MKGLAGEGTARGRPSPLPSPQGEADNLARCEKGVTRVGQVERRDFVRRGVKVDRRGAKI